MSGMTPILLLDEIAAHLDPGRRAALFERLAALGCQAFMTGHGSRRSSRLSAGIGEILTRYRQRCRAARRAGLEASPVLHCRALSASGRAASQSASPQDPPARRPAAGAARRVRPVRAEAGLGVSLRRADAGASDRTQLVWQPDWPLYRYDALFLAADPRSRSAFLALKLESFDEAKVILIYHWSAPPWRSSRSHMGSWSYPEPASCASPACRSSPASCTRRSEATWRAPSASSTCASRTTRASSGRLLLAAAIYVNFFSHHFLLDMRWLLVRLDAAALRARAHLLHRRPRAAVDAADRRGAADRLLPVGRGKCRDGYRHLALSRAARTAGISYRCRNSAPGICF